MEKKTCYDYKVFKKEGTVLTEVHDFDFSNLEVKGEFEEMEYIYLLYQREDFIEGLYIKNLLLAMCKEILPYAKIRMIYNPEHKLEDIIAVFEKANLDMKRMEFYAADLQEIWLRDSMPTFVRNKLTGEIIAVKMYFDIYGSDTEYYGENIKNENEQVIELIQKLPDISYVIICNYIQEGGARLFNGKGTCLLNEHYDRKRNPDFDKSKTEELFKKVFGVKNFIWLPYASVYEDSDFSEKFVIEKGEDAGQKIHSIVFLEGHVDGFAAFANPYTILHTSFDNLDGNEITKENTRRLSSNLEVLKNAVDQHGNNFMLVGLPNEFQTVKKIHASNKLITYYSVLEEDVIEQYLSTNKGIYIPTTLTYSNILMLKGKVINNSYGKNEEFKKSDEKCMEILKGVYPESIIAMVDAEAVNWAGGSLHCLSAHQSI